MSLKNEAEWHVGGKLHRLTRRGMIMGIVNVTPDSFFDGGKLCHTGAAVDHALKLISQGADIADVGGESTRPGAAPVSAQEEMDRVLPVIQQLRAQTSALISVDTFKASVAEAAVEAGADIINDITGLRGDPEMVGVAVRHPRAALVVMHMQGMPRTMQNAPQYSDVVYEVMRFFRERIESLAAAGIAPERIALDPGIGFGKLLEHNLALLNATPEFCCLGHPVLMGVSRKSFIGQILGQKSMSERFWPTVALTSVTRELGATIHRVHDVAECAQAMRMTEAIMHGRDLGSSAV